MCAKTDQGYLVKASANLQLLKACNKICIGLRGKASERQQCLVAGGVKMRNINFWVCALRLQV